MAEILGLGYVPFYKPDGSIFCTVPVFSLDQSLSQYTGTVITFESASLAELTGLEFNITNEILVNSLNITYDDVYDLSDNILPSTKKLNSTDYRYGLYAHSGEGGDAAAARLSNDGKWVSWTGGGDIFAIWYNPLYSKYIFAGITINDNGKEEMVGIGRNFTDYGISDLEIAQTPISPGPFSLSVEDVEISPSTPTYVNLGDSIQFTGTLKLSDGSTVSADATNSKWTISSDSVDDVTELDGIIISQDGLVSVSMESTIGMFNVKLRSVGYAVNRSTSTRIMISENYKGPYGDGTVSGPGGGGGQFGKNEVSDIIAGDIPLGSVEGDASATGMYTRYLCNSRYLDIIGDWLWTTDLGLAIAKSVISLIYGDPSESLISLMSYPFSMAGLLTTRSQDLFWGHHDSGLPFHAITSAAFQIDWGVISLQEYWGNFLDYAPHTKIDLYLPWGTGFVSIDPGQCLPGTLQVVTNVEISKGSCIHNVIGNNGCVIGTFAGQCGKQVPLISSDMASKIAGLVTAGAAGIAVGVAGAAGAGVNAAAMAKGTRGITENFIKPQGGWGSVDRGRMIMDSAIEGGERGFAQGARSAGKIVASSLAVNKSPVHVTRNGGFTDGSASLGIQYPYIILSRPKQSVPEEYGHHYGYPSNIYSSLALLHGYTEVGEIHLNGIPATDEELSEIDAILKGGVIL